MFDSNMSFDQHISKICQSSFFLIRQLRQIRPMIDYDSAIILANSLVQTKIDYCNSLLSGLPASAVNRLQRVQNSLARVVCRAPKFRSSSSALLKRLHWLPVAQRIQYKICVLTFKALHLKMPPYLSELIKPYNPSRSLRSSFANLLAVPDIRSAIGRRSFSFAAPTLWNSLPLSLRSCTCLTTFCKNLKTHLFPP